MILFTFDESIEIISECNTLKEIMKVSDHFREYRTEYPLMDIITLSQYIDEKYNELKLIE